MRASLALPLVLTLTSSSPSAAVSEDAGGPLLPCATSGDFVTDQRQVLGVFEFVKGVCAQRGESCPSGAPLPTSCGTPECQRAVQLAGDSCRSGFAKDGFLKSAFGPVLDAATAVCAAAAQPVSNQVSSVPALLHPNVAQVRFQEAPSCIATNPPRSVRHSATSLLVTTRKATHFRLRWVKEGY